MVCRDIVRTAVFVCAIVFGAIPFNSAALAESFDKPLHKTVVDLGPSPDQPDFPNLHVHLSCYYYPAFMVKELDDDGNKGALRISILSVKEEKAPRCARALSPSERAIPESGYFWGVKDAFIFLIADDGEGEGRYFEVFDAITLRRTFKDALRFNTEPDFSRTVDGRSSMRYQRVFFAKCSLMKDGAGCWRRVMQQTGLGNAPMPKCSGYDDDVADPSLIAFPVRVLLSTKPERKVLAGSVLCFAAQ